MPSTLSTVVLLASLVSSALSLPSQYDFSKVDSSKIIKRDVVVVGGGSAGVHAAITLKDNKRTVIVIETKNRLGGHTETVEDAKTGIKTEAGVILLHNETEVQRYFRRFNIPLANISLESLSNTTPFDYRTGQAIPPAAIQGPSQQAVGLAFQKLAGFLAQWPQLDSGLFVPNPCPPELAQPFSSLVKQLGLEALVPAANNLAQNIGDFLNTPVLEVTRLIGLSLIKTVSTQSFVTSARRDNSELYLKATAELNDAHSLLLNSNVIHTKRKNNGVEVVVQTPNGIEYICAKKLLMAIPPRVEALKPFDLRQNEKDVFSKLLVTGYYTSLLNNTGFPANLSGVNIAPEKPYGIPDLPSGNIFGAGPIPGLVQGLFSTPASRSTYAYSDDFIKKQIIDTIKRMQAANPKTFKQTTPEFVFWSSHTPYAIQARTEDILAGIYDKMYKLQGQASTFWTGAAWRCNDSSNIWRFNLEVVIPALLKSL